ncbi:unnamed protein product [Hyaloperonospora brassicae]|uniref:Ribosomal RNA-processing protein 14/surfeit locus protein 6 C-terminal domain-containing protein n=1 Tax=Hyaloperonospora brassicae TaxID=162125 RepID=A0AAV0TM24_HYABA|nr:unnamed protein product [Hyaloperonospora brassicae]CAI5724132.1 unnamed protein product [Hyaloperonospora brassicae]
MLLGRSLLQTTARADAQSAAPSDATLDAIRAHDVFFCDMLAHIPAHVYFPTDAEANWKKTAPRKYHKNVQAQQQRESTKKSVLKRAKFSPAAAPSNEARQQSSAAPGPQETKQHVLAPVKRLPLHGEAHKGGALDGLRARLAVKIQTMREQRKAEETTGKKRPSRAEVVAEQRALKKRKTAANKSKARADKREHEAAAQSPEDGQAAPTTDSAVDTTSISYGSLLLDDGVEKDKKAPATRHGQSVRGIQNLLKKAERNAQRLEELKKTEDGAEKVKAKGWETALHQAAGKVVLDDPKLLRAKLKKKEKSKAKSSKEWKERVAKLEVSKKERQKKKLSNALGRGKKEAVKPVEKKGRKGPRAGFEGRKGDAFLNAGKKGSKFAGKKSAAPSK